MSVGRNLLDRLGLTMLLYRTRATATGAPLPPSHSTYSSSSSPTCPDPTPRLSRRSSGHRSCATRPQHPFFTDTFTSVRPRTFILSSACRKPPKAGRRTPYLDLDKAGGHLKSQVQGRKTSSSRYGHFPSKRTTTGGATACRNCRFPTCKRFDSISLVRVQISSTPNISDSPASPFAPSAPKDLSSAVSNRGQDCHRPSHPTPI